MEEEHKEPKRKKFITYMLLVSKLLVFITFIYTALIMYQLGNLVIAGVIVVAVSLFMIFNKLEAMNKGI